MIDIRPIVPPSLNRYREPIGEAFEYFLQRTSTGRRLEPGRLKPEAGRFDHWVRLALAHPTLHKLAQVLARHRALPPDLRAGLQTLESLTPHTSLHEIHELVRSELGRELNQLDLGEASLAEGSVAVVVPFVLRSPNPLLPSRGVLKVLKPGIRDRLEEELSVWSQVGEFFQDRCRHHDLPDADFRDSFDTVANLLRHEIDFAAEQRHLAAAARTLSGVRGVRIPRLLPYCTPRITAMERIDGTKVTDCAILPPADRRDLARRVVDALVAQPMWSGESDALFHADPHAGNLMVTPDGELVVLDWALTGTLARAEREHLAQLLLSAHLLDLSGLCRAIENLCLGAGPNTSRLRAVAERSFGVRPPEPGPSFAWVATLMDAAAMECGARFSDGLLLFRKTLMILDGVIADMVGERGLDELLFSSAVRRLVLESPARVFLPPGSRRFGSRLSSLDLLRAGCLFPLVAASQWLGGLGATRSNPA